jgi:hypothetical protein
VPYVHGDALEDGECKCTGLDISRYSRPGDALLYLSPGSNVRRVHVRVRPSFVRSSVGRRIAPVCVHVRNVKVLACSLFFRSVPSARDATLKFPAIARSRPTSYLSHVARDIARDIAL